MLLASRIFDHRTPRHPLRNWSLISFHPFRSKIENRSVIREIHGNVHRNGRTPGSGVTEEYPRILRIENAMILRAISRWSCGIFIGYHRTTRVYRRLVRWAPTTIDIAIFRTVQPKILYAYGFFVKRIYLTVSPCRYKRGYSFAITLLYYYICQYFSALPVSVTQDIIVIVVQRRNWQSRVFIHFFFFHTYLNS